ncbi:MAG: carbohydrate ABC transporter permease [Thermoanaerobacteraceae bacterium]
MKTLDKRKINSLYRNYEGYLFISPWLIGFFVFMAGPMIYSFILSFMQYDIFTTMKFIGIKNFTDMFRDSLFIKSLKVTIFYVFISVPLRLATALIIAMILNIGVRGMSIYRTIYYLPSIIGGGVAVSVMWKMLLSREGSLNTILSSIGLGPYNFLASPDLSLPTLSVIAAWQFGSAMVIFLAGLKQIPKELYEASTVDGATKIQQFFNITIPLLTPTIFFNLVMGMIGAFQVFTQGFIITQGGPANSTLFYVLYMYKVGFTQFRMGYASAIAWFLTIIILIITVILFRTSGKWVYYES